MTPERWSQLKEIFAAVTDLPAAERTPALKQACGGDTELQAELEQLLAQHDEMGRFLEGAPSATFTGLLSPGSLVAQRYRIASLLGMGGMGEVYEAEDNELGDRIALKILRPQMSLDQAALDRFRREVLLARRVTHPNVCRVFDIGRHQQQGREVIFLTMELVHGETLSHRLKRTGRIAPDEALIIATQLCQALDAAHKVGILHRDFKCGNVMLVGEGESVRAIVADFGIARWIAPAAVPQNTVSLTLVAGTPAYMSPEQVQGRELTAASDIYSLGLVLYETVTGIRPFQDKSLWAEATKRLTEAPVAPARLIPELNGGWSRTILHCLEREPLRRPATVEQVLAALCGKRRPFSIVLEHRRLAAMAAFVVLAAVMLGISFRSRLWLTRLPADKRVAVLPFSYAGNDSARLASAYGLSESLTRNLARLETSNSKLWVVPWSQVRNWDPQNSEHVPGMLGVNLVVTGMVEHQGKGLRLHAELRDASTLKNLRSRTIDVSGPEVVILEERLLEQVSAMLQVQPTAGMLQHLAVDHTAVPGAYEFYEQGRGYLRHDDPPNVDLAISLLQKAKELDPRFAIAYADLGFAEILKYRYTREMKWLQQARVTCSQALALNDSLAPAHLTQGMILQESGDLDGAIREFRRALSLDPSDEETLRRLALAYDAAGKVLQAEELIKDTIRRKPADWVSYNFLGYLYFRHAEYAQAEPLFQAASQLAPDYPLALYNLGGVYLVLGKYKEAEAVLARAVTVKPSAGAYSNLGTAYFHLGNYSEATVAFLKATELTPRNYLLWGNLADTYDMAGDRSRAVDAYARAIQELEPVLALRGNDGSLLESLALYYAKLGRKKEAEVVLARALRNPADTPEFPFNAARIYELTGRRKQALSALRRALRAGYSLSEIQSDADFAQLRTDHRYSDIVGVSSGKLSR
ncbi:MAG: protein kinase domain-containing protein [Actinomycetota bacterium]